MLLGFAVISEVDGKKVNEKYIDFVVPPHRRDILNSR